MNVNFASRLERMKKGQLWLALVLLSIGLTMSTVSLLDLLLNGKITFDYLLTGFIASLLVASIICGILIYFLQKLAILRQDNEHLKAIIDACPIPIAINDDHNNILMLNPEFQNVFGYFQEDIPTLTDWWPKAYPDPVYQEWVQKTWMSRLESSQLSNSSFEPLEVSIRCKNGDIKTVAASANPINGAITGRYLVVLYDLTERVYNANALIQSRTILQSIIENIPIRVFWKNTESRYLGCNTSFANDGGESCPDDLIGKTDFQLTWRNQASLYRADDQEVIQSGIPKLFYEEPQTTPDGKQILLRTSKVPLQDTFGNVIGILGIYEDCTQQREIEKELWLAKAMLDKSQTAFYRLSPTGQVLYINDYACKSLGYSRDELIGLYPWDFDPDFQEAQWPEVWNHLQNHEVFNLETRHQRKDGSIMEVEITGHYITHQGSEYSFTFVQDISERKRIERALHQKERYQRALLNNFPFMVWLKDMQSHFLAVNEMLAKSLGENNPNNLIGKTDFDYLPFDLAESYQIDDKSVLSSRARKYIEEEYVDFSGLRSWIETYKAPVIDEDGSLLGTVGFARDITDRKKIETDLRILATAFESQEGIVITDANTIILKINSAFSSITGYTQEDSIGRKMKLLKSGIHDHAFYTEMWNSIRQTGTWQGEIWNKRKNGEIFPQWLTITAVKDEASELSYYVGSLIDITTRKEIEKQIKHMAHYDALTDLPNRTLFNDRMHQNLALAKREKQMLAVLYLDLDKFKPVNDNFGHDMGDLLLRQVANRLLSCVQRESDTTSRIGGDEFIILLTHIEHEQDVEQVAEKILFALNQPFIIEQQELNISASIGIAIYPIHGNEMNLLIRNADTALYQAKRNGRSCFCIYSGAE